jgi:hypothetical protein
MPTGRPTADMKNSPTIARTDPRTTSQYRRSESRATPARATTTPAFLSPAPSVRRPLTSRPPRRTRSPSMRFRGLSPPAELPGLQGALLVSAGPGPRAARPERQSHDCRALHSDALHVSTSTDTRTALRGRPSPARSVPQPVLTTYCHSWALLAERPSSPARPAQVAMKSQKHWCGPGQVQRLGRCALRRIADQGGARGVSVRRCAKVFFRGAADRLLG